MLLQAESPSSTVRRTSRGIPTRIHGKERFWLEEGRMSVRIYDTTRLWGSTQLRGSSKCRAEHVESKAAKDGVYNSLYDKMIWDEIQDAMQCKLPWESIYPGVFPIYTPRRSVHLSNPCISVHPESHSLSPSSLYPCTPAVAQSSAKLNGCVGGGRRIFSPHREVWGRCCVARSVWWVACRMRQVAGGWNHDVGLYPSLNLSLARPPRRNLTLPHDHGVDNCSLRFGWNGKQLDFGESRSPT